MQSDIDMDSSSGLELFTQKAALTNRTNAPDHHDITLGSDRKRPADEADTGGRKRVKLAGKDRRQASIQDVGTEAQKDEACDPLPLPRRQWSTYSMRIASMMSQTRFPGHPYYISSTSLLQSFVSSNKTDLYKCHSIVDDGSYFTLPYACAYSGAAKRGEMARLAVSTEQGVVHVLDTRKRHNDWDGEPQRKVIQVFPNGVFDVKWSPTDSLLATASAGASIQVSDPEAQKVLRVLSAGSGTIKCLAWSPEQQDNVLCSGGRDGRICIWDLRNNVEEPVMEMPDAHEDIVKTPKPRTRKGKVAPAAPQRSITSVLYPDDDPYGIISSGSLDGVLRHWDLRLFKRKAIRSRKHPTHISSLDPTTYQGARRARGITSLCQGTGSTAGLLFALGNDSLIHTYDTKSLTPLSGQLPFGQDPYAYTHPNMRTNSFYVRVALSPCGRWLASGGADNGSVYLFDVSNAGRVEFASSQGPGVQLKGQVGEVGAVDWADGTVASCADDGTVRVWRPDIDTYRRCQEDPKEMEWEWSWAREC
ncbi:WD40 repeat-like protein [Panus rudis PR-1116 ss-1]|nr:WD40 repeat-like protein [Panus rudis PR-1116 ss-1]